MFHSSKKAISIVEILLSLTILIIGLVGLLQTFVYCSYLNDLAFSMTSSLVAAQDKLEEIRDSNYSTLTTDYASGGTPGNTFTIPNVNGKGAISIDASNANLLSIRIVVCFKTKNGRLIGDDANLDGSVDAGDGNGQIDSPIVLISLLAKR